MALRSYRLQPAVPRSDSASAGCLWESLWWWRIGSFGGTQNNVEYVCSRCNIRVAIAQDHVCSVVRSVRSATGICQTAHRLRGRLTSANVRLRLEAQVSAFSTFHAEYTETQGDRVPEWCGFLQYSLALNGKKFYLRTHGSYRDPSG